MGTRPKAFISYSWDSEEHKEWVLNLANRLVSEYGIDVILDQYDLQAGKVMTRFMERAIGIADKVVLILTPNYKLKAESSSGGVGFEYSMISQGLFDTQSDNIKFIPVLRSGTSKESMPGYIKTLIYHSMNDDMVFDSSLYDLAKLICDKPAIVKPELGAIPNFDQRPADKDPILERAKNITNRAKFEEDKKRYLESHEGYQEAINQFYSLMNELESKAQYYKQNTGLSFWFSKLKSSGGDPLSFCDLNLNKKGRDNICYHFEFAMNEKEILFHVSKWDKPPRYDRGIYYRFPEDEAKELSNSRDKYIFDLNMDMQPKWRDKACNLLEYQDIVKIYFEKLLEDIDNAKPN